jgi:hypothetical protein
MERTAAGEYRKSPEHPPLLLIQQIVAPLERAPERPLPRRQIESATPQQTQPLLKPGEQRPRREQLHASRRQFYRKR